MSPAERQQVIDALENSVPKPMDGDDDYCEGGWKRHREALAIMRSTKCQPDANAALPLDMPDAHPLAS